MVHLALRLLGGLEVRRATGASVDFPTKKAKALLAHLARHPGQRVSREKLATLLWASSDDAHACVSLRQTLTLLRKSLSHCECACVVSAGDRLYLDPERVDVDVAEFDQLCRERSLNDLERVAALYQGEFLEGFDLNEEPYEEWLRMERTSLRERAIEALMTLLRCHMDAGNLEQGVRVARRVLSFDPLRETAHCALMRLYADVGDRSLALRQYQSCCDVLNVELGVEPETKTQELYEDIRRGQRVAHVKEDMPAEGEGRNAPPLPDKPSIAVLPFLNLSADATQDYFSDGITNDIITELSRFRSMFVIARHSSFAYRGKAVNVRGIGRELGVRYVVEGSVSKIGDRVRVSAELVDAETGHHLWADRYDRSLAEIFAVQDELVRTIVSTLDRRIDVAGKLRTATTNEWSLRAYDLYLRAAAAQDRNTKGDYRYAQECLERAIELDPGLAQAHHHLSLVKFFTWMERWVDDLDKVFAEALHAARDALARDDTDSMVQAHLGMLHMYRREFDQAGLRFAEALRLNPNDSRALGLYGLFLSAIGRAEQAIDQFARAERLNPLRPRWLNRLKGIAYFSAGRYADAIAAFRLNEAAPVNQERGWLAASCAQAGRLEEAGAYLQSFLCVAQKEMAVLPGRTVGAWRSCWRPIEYQNEEDFDHLFDGLRKAGLPE
jgi:TolB-like protein/DNA-binding SARP family transcriptional activator/Flp pilus assembly protein TadD